MISVLSSSPIVFEEIDQPADVMVRVLAGIRRRPPSSAHRASARRPGACPSPARRGRGGTASRLRNDAELLLLGEDLLAILVPAVVELAFVLVGPLLRHVVRRMHRTRGEVEEEGLVGRELLGIGDELIALSARSSVR